MERLQTRPARRVSVADTGLPRKVLKHLFVDHRIGIGGRFLDVGCGDSQLLAFATQLGLDADGLVCGPHHALDRSQPRHPDLQYIESCQHGVPIPEHSVDLVLVRDLELYQGSLNQTLALETTAQLLACLRPGGHFVLLLPHGAAEFDRHADACFVRHLVSFPGSVGMETLSSPRWSWFSGSQPGTESQFTMVTLATPREPVSRAMWRAAARAASKSGRLDCCERAAHILAVSAPAKAA